MIIKIWRYAIAPDGHEGRPRTAQKNAFDVVYGCGKYINGLEIERVESDAYEEALIEADFVSDATRAGSYIMREDDHDVIGSASHGLGDGDTLAKIQRLAVAAAAAGLDYFYHYTWSHRNGEVFEPHRLARQNRSIRHVLEASGCPSLEAYHREQRGPQQNETEVHGHGNLLSVDAKGQGKPLADGWFKEAAQVAIAVVERDDELRPEPLRRYIATEDGVYSFLTGTRVADRTGRILRSKDKSRVDREGNPRPDGGLMKRVREDHDVIIASNEAPPGIEPGTPWSLQRYVQVVVAPRIKQSGDWQETHRSLAPLGIRYGRVGNTGRLEAIGPDGQPTGEWVGAGDAYANAALGKLANRFKAKFEAPKEKLDFRPLTMPVFNRPPAETADEKIDRDARAKQEATDLKPEIARIEDLLSKDDKRKRQRIKDAKLGRTHNAAVAEQASRRRSEEAVVREFAIAKGAKRTRKRSDEVSARRRKASGWQAVRLIIWGHLRLGMGRKKPPRELEKRYEIRRVDNEVQYWLRSTSGEPTIAFVETDNLVTVRDTSRQANIDALRIAKDKYSRVRIAGTQRAVLDTVRIAAELGIVLEDEQAETGKAHLDAIANRSVTRILDISRRFHATRYDRRRARQAAAEARDKRFDPQTGMARPALGMSLEGLVAVYLEREPTRSIATGDDPVLLEARRKLDEEIDHDRLFLTSSRYHRKFEGQEYHFLDEVHLVRAFGSEPEVLVDREIQNRLRAIEAIQLEKRRAIAAALVSGAARITDGELAMEDRHNSWAKDFWRAQRSDPTFHRLIQVAWARPDRFAYDPGLEPGEATRRRALLQGDHVFAESIERELTRQRERTVGGNGIPAHEPSPRPVRPERSTPPAEDRSPSTLGSLQSPAPDNDREANSRPSRPWHPSSQGVER
ncbi:MAG: hypothetical protein JJ901_08060 [Erythrobacter sp.]|uniref:LPD7 domain-containing protein n=1 Tax=Erythrobacter sp. TaxID=1042 RepID=UPI001B1EB48B|nr:LPD7 domain-containing protein [Erythrobacter sp.]MBO6768243.1 hypothetical protein [Erythrobacter sp.]